MSDETNGASGADGAASEETAAMADRLAALEAELAETKDRLLRALAETENVRRRAQREREDAQRYAAGNLAKDLLNVADNLRRALNSVPDEKVREDVTRSLVAGVSATERELLAAFERHGIRRLEPQPGERFDHNLHEAMLEVENSGRPPGSVVQVLQPGYMVHDRLLRPAMVSVAKASPGAPDLRLVDEVI